MPRYRITLIGARTVTTNLTVAAETEQEARRAALATARELPAGAWQTDYDEDTDEVDEIEVHDIEEDDARYVNVVYWDIDRHGVGCHCGLCNMNGRSYGVAIFDAGTDLNPLEVVYAPSEEAAADNARLLAQNGGWVIVPKDDE
jgi:hypothetical protein